MPNKIAIVTGATSGIGKEVTNRLSDKGFDVIATGRNQEKLQELYAKNKHVFCFVLDVTDKDNIKHFYHTIKADFKRVDVLINNAGVMYLSKVEAGEKDGWEEMINVNLRGLIYNTYQFIDWIKEFNEGHIINIASLAGLRVLPERVVYSATKSAVRSFSEGIRQEISEWNVRVTTISPGVVQTNILKHVTEKSIQEKINQRKFKPLSPIDIANAVIYAIQQPDHVNVSEIVIRPVGQKY
ncbi:SDR family oxidoreductase [Pseudalkalibacillus sp. A8]|uniref:SDR family oxidoreductase n=1 Tax=Pseudalkalibacillus sp. A8 TaxID=3382641 RepID=UPI0038B5CFBB